MKGNEFFINVAGIPRRLFTVEERSKTGDLTIKIRQGVFATTDQNYDVILPEPETKRFRFSVHNTPDDENFSLINFTRVVGSGVSENKRNFTSAMKKSRRFSPVYYYRANNLSDEQYLFDPSKNYLPKITLGEFDPSQFQLIYALYVGRPDLNIYWSRKGKFNAVHTLYSKFRLTVIWSYLGYPSDSTSDVLVIENSNAVLSALQMSEEERAYAAELAKGRFLNDLTVDFYFFAERLRDLYYRKISHGYGENSETFHKVLRATSGDFFQKGRTDTIAFLIDAERRNEAAKCPSKNLLSLLNRL